MFCPQCGSTQGDDLKYCKTCGANLYALRQVMASRETSEKFNWNKTWVADMFMSGEEAVKRAADIDRLRGVTPETRRRNEIKGGVISAGTGLALAIFLYVLMQGIIIGGVSETAAAILSRIWVVGIIPLFVGIALIVNGVFVSRRGTAAHEEREETPALAPSGEERPAFEAYAAPASLPSADTNELAARPFSVTDETTRNLVGRGEKK